MSRDFLLQVFFMNYLPPSPRIWHKGRIFPKIRGGIRKWRCTTGINNTSGKFCHRYRWCCRYRWQIATGVNDTGGKFATGVNGTGGNLPPVSTTLAANLPPVSNLLYYNKTASWSTYLICDATCFNVCSLVTRRSNFTVYFLLQFFQCFALEVWYVLVLPYFLD